MNLSELLDNQGENYHHLALAITTLGKGPFSLPGASPRHDMYHPNGAGFVISSAEFTLTVVFRNCGVQGTHMVSWC
jgi:hypothetical protein